MSCSIWIAPSWTTCLHIDTTDVLYIYLTFDNRAHESSATNDYSLLGPHHSAVIVNRPNRRNEPQTVSEPSEIGSFGPHDSQSCRETWAGLHYKTNEPRALLYRKLCVYQHNKFGVFPEKFPWHWLWERAWEWWMGQEEYILMSYPLQKTRRDYRNARSHWQFRQDHHNQVCLCLVAIKV
jgi:hypothetical protein